MYDWSKYPRHIVYALIDPRDKEVRYIGRSSCGPARPLEHRTRTKRERTHKAAWVRSLLKQGLSYIVVVLEICQSKSHAIEAEKAWISQGRRAGWRLTNLTDGGEGASVKKLQLPDAEIVERYRNGESEKALADAYHVQRWTIRRRLIDGGAQIRGRSAAMFLRMQQMSPEERKALARPANEAFRVCRKRRVNSFSFTKN